LRLAIRIGDKPAMAPPLLMLQDIHINLGSVPLLRGAELTVGAGDRICLIGRNGSGKSTLLKIAAGLLPVDQGTQFLQPGATIRYLPQEPELAGFATTLAYVESGMGPGDDAYRAVSLLQSLGLTGAEQPVFPVARRAAPPWPGRWRPSPTSFCSTSRPTISTCRRSNGWKVNSGGCAPASC
jgi:energy-coupling factor transporter ATP-binding protein EcfA2